MTRRRLAGPLAFSLWAVAMLSMAATVLAAAPTSQLGEQVHQLQAEFHQGSVDPGEASRRLEALAAQLGAAAGDAAAAGQIAEQARLLVWQAVALLDTGTVAEARGGGPNPQAYELMAQAEQAAARATGLTPRDSEAHRIYGEISMRLLSYRGGAGSVELAARAFRELDMALRLNPRNPMALIAMAQFQWGAPPEFTGGGPRRGLQLIAEALRVADTDLQRYLAYVWKGNLHRKLGDEQSARAAYTAALDIYPNGGMARLFLEGGRA